MYQGLSDGEIEDPEEIKLEYIVFEPKGMNALNSDVAVYPLESEVLMTSESHLSRLCLSDIQKPDNYMKGIL